MICRQVNICKPFNPVPISFLIREASAFDCDIFIKCNNRNVNVKSYEDVKNHLRVQGESLIFLFNGWDELAAGKKMERIFQS